MDGLKPEGISHVRRLTTFRDGQRKDTSLLVLTFETTALPDTLLAGHIRYKVNVFIPNPLRCFNCQRFGHSSKFCRQTPRCQKCGAAPHEGTPCSAPIKCLSCDATDHTTNSNQCPVWKTEKEICAVRATTGVSYPQARRTVEERMPSPSSKTYAQKTKTQTATSQTQTDPISQLPPLALLKPVATESTACTQTPTEQPTPPAPKQVNTPRTNPVTQTPQTSTHPGGWQTVRSKHTRPTGTGHPHPHPQSPARGRPERQSRPAVRVAMGKNRSQSVGRYPPVVGGNSIFT